jgi:hypothetical protein
MGKSESNPSLLLGKKAGLLEKPLGKNYRLRISLGRHHRRFDYGKAEAVAPESEKSETPDPAIRNACASKAAATASRQLLFERPILSAIPHTARAQCRAR